MRPVATTHTRPKFPTLASRSLFLLVLAAGCSAADKAPTGIVPGAMALGKFCHELSRSGAPVTLTLQLGDPAIVSISAQTGVCAPMIGQPCTTIPMGNVPVKLFEGDKLLSTRNALLLPQKAGEPTKEYLFQAAVNNSNLQVVVIGGQIATGTCSGLDFPPPDGGVLDGGGDAGDGSAALEAGAAEAGATPDAGAPDASAVVDAAADSAADTAVDLATPDTAADSAND